ncbi:MAG: 4'-phosphopantetheinyl transferase [Monoraphidium minutum]|nr:MAG: 4'-phosphopantetheinyl transferase [Monoraphidium minutum]
MLQQPDPLVQPRPHPARRRWLVDASAWHPAEGEVAWLAGLLPPEDAAAVAAFRFEDDRKRAVVSRLLARRCCADALGLPWGAVAIKRTRGRKPFCANTGGDRGAAPNFNFNVSHEGDYVLLASEPLAIVGVDVAAPQQLRRGGRGAGAAGAAEARPLLEALAAFRGQLSAEEWRRLQSLHPDEAAIEAAFQQAWGAKEAYVKARGDGLGFEPMSRIHVDVLAAGEGGGGGGADGAAGGVVIASGVASGHGGGAGGGGGGAAAGGALEARLTVDGAPRPRWRVHVQSLPRRHWAAVALAPPEEVVDAFAEFTATLRRPVISDADMAALLALPPQPFELLCVGDLLPPDLAADYEDRFG